MHMIIYGYFGMKAAYIIYMAYIKYIYIYAYVICIYIYIYMCIYIYGIYIYGIYIYAYIYTHVYRYIYIYKTIYIYIHVCIYRTLMQERRMHDSACLLQLGSRAVEIVEEVLGPQLPPPEVLHPQGMGEELVISTSFTHSKIQIIVLLILMCYTQHNPIT